MKQKPIKCLLNYPQRLLSDARCHARAGIKGQNSIGKTCWVVCLLECQRGQKLAKGIAT